MSSSASLQQKQQYLRTNIPSDQYEDFYQFCESVLGSVDINSWSMEKVQESVRRYNRNASEQKGSTSNLHEKYNQYQSKSNERYDRHEESEVSECASSRIQKKSAIDLLDSVLEEQNNSSVKVQQKVGVSTSRSSVDVNAKANVGVSFDAFDFWTSTVNVGASKQISMSNAQTERKSTNYSPVTTKNNYSNDYLNPTAQRPRHSTQNFNKNSDFDIFTTGTATQQTKTSPYLKKQNNEPYEPHRSQIKLKETHDYKPAAKVQTKDEVKVQKLQKVQIPFQETINCFKSTNRTQLSDRNLNIFLGSHQIVERKFLAADYAMYNVKITPLNIQCKRNYQDFLKLRNNLAKFFPGICLPYLEETSWLTTSTNSDFITNQKKMLQFFARDLLRNRQIRNSRVMQDFLTLRDHKQIKRKFEKYEGMQQLKGLEELCVLQGKVHSTINSDQKNYIENFQKFVIRMDHFYERQQHLTNNIINQYQQLMNSHKSLINLMQQMQKQVRDFNTKVMTNTIKHLGHAFKLVKDTYKEQLTNLQYEHQINSKKLLPFLKYERNNFKELEKLLHAEKKLRRSFQKRSLTQKIGEGESYRSESTKDAKRKVLQQSESLIVLKHQVGYAGYQLRHQGQRVFDELAVKTAVRWQSLGDSYSNKLSKSKDYWRDFQAIDLNIFATDMTY